MHKTLSKNVSLLKFGKGNSKLSKTIHTFSLPAGYTCMGADKCLAKANPETGKIKDGPNTEFRCFSASQESLYPSVRKARWHNFNLLRKAKTVDSIKELILKSLPAKAEMVRLHVSGDMFSQNYFDAWLNVAKEKPNILFYGYTKSLSYWLARKDEIPKNLILTASEGGKQDDLITKNKLRYAKVVFSKGEAKKLKLPLDHDDSHAYTNGPSFGLLLHGIQPKNSLAGKALSALRSIGENGYSRKVSLPVI